MPGKDGQFVAAYGRESGNSPIFVAHGETMQLHLTELQASRLGHASPFTDNSGAARKCSASVSQGATFRKPAGAHPRFCF